MSDLLDFSPPGQLANDSLAGAKAYFYDAGTTTPRTVYSDSGLTTAHPSPLVADADGLFAQTFVSGAAVKVVVTDSADGSLYTLDPCSKIAASGAAASAVSFSPTSDIPDTNVQDAIEQVQANIDGLGTASTLDSDEIAPKGHIFGLAISNNSTDANNDIDVATGQAASDGTTPVMLALDSTITKRLDAAWAVGTGNGGLDAGSKANSTCYFVWLIRRSDTGVVDVLFSTSKTSPTMPTNYDQKRRLPGAIFTDGSGNIRAFTQVGKRRFDFVTRVADVSATNPGSSAVLRTVTVPAGMLGHFEVQITNDYLALTSTDQTDVGPDSSTGFTLVSSGARVGAQATVAVDGSNQIRSRFNSGSSVVLGIATIGFTDPEV